jgi:hypothetical protein
MTFVRTEVFYVTAAQVLPMLLIALAVEVNLLLERRRRALEQVHRQMIDVFETLAREAATVGQDQPDVSENHLRLHREIINEYRWWFRHHQAGTGGQRRWSIRAGIVFMLGETAAVVALLVGPDGAVGLVAGPVTAFALLALSLLAAILPLLRLPGLLEVQEPDPRVLLERLRADRLAETERMLRKQPAGSLGGLRMATFDPSSRGKKRRKAARGRRYKGMR